MTRTGPSFQHRSSHEVPASPETVWRELERVELWESWARALRAVDVSTDGFEEGTVIDAHVDPRGPFDVDVTVELVRCDPPHEVDAEITGDIRGQGALRLRGSEGATEITVAWNVEVIAGDLKGLARGARPFSGWLQRRSTGRLARDLREHLRQL